MDLEVGHQELNHRFRHVRRDLQANDIAEAALPDAGLNRLEQVLGFELLDCNFGVAGDVKAGDLPRSAAPTRQNAIRDAGAAWPIALGCDRAARTVAVSLEL
jgi:hypothetical protein